MPAESGLVETALEHLTALSLPERAAELLENVTESLEQDALAMDQLLAPWLPESDWGALSPEQRKNWLSLELILREAFQALVLARMVIRQEQTYKGATWVTYEYQSRGRERREPCSAVVGVLRPPGGCQPAGAPGRTAVAPSW